MGTGIYTATIRTKSSIFAFNFVHDLVEVYVGSSATFIPPAELKICFLPFIEHVSASFHLPTICRLLVILATDAV